MNEVNAMPKRKNPEPIYPVLEAEIVKRGILKKSIAELLELAPRMLSTRLTGKFEFTLGQAIAIQEKFFPDMDIKMLFNKNEGS